MRRAILSELLDVREQLVMAKEAADRGLRAVDGAISATYALRDRIRDSMDPVAMDKPDALTRPEVMDALVERAAEEPGPFERCPICGDTSLVRLPLDKLDRSGVPIVGCGNPWHYLSERPAVKPLTAAELPSMSLHPREQERFEERKPLMIDPSRL